MRRTASTEGGARNLGLVSKRIALSEGAHPFARENGCPQLAEPSRPRNAAERFSRPETIRARRERLASFGFPKLKTERAMSGNGATSPDSRSLTLRAPIHTVEP